MAEGIGAIAFRFECQIAGSEDTAVAVAVDETVCRIAIGPNRRRFVDAMLVFECRRRTNARSAAGNRCFIGCADIVYFYGNVLHAIAVENDPLCFGMFGTE